MTPLLAQRPRSADRAFERLYQEHVHAVYRYALAVLHSEHDAEDVTQTTFLSAYRAFQRGERLERPHNWLIKIAHNVCRQRFRDASRRPQEVEFDETTTPAVAPDDSDVPTAGEIRRALGFLGFNQRAALVMRELEGRSYAEIAQILDISVGAVETLIFRARRALREQLEGGLTCAEAEITLARLEERRLSSDERSALRAHLRECNDCAVLERRRRAQRATLKNLGAIPLPASLGSFFGTGAAGGGVALGGMGIGTKIATVLAAGLVASGIGHEAVKAVAAKKQPASNPPAAAQSTKVPLSAVTALARSGASARRLEGRAAKKARARSAHRRGFGASARRSVVSQVRGQAPAGSQSSSSQGGQAHPGAPAPPPVPEIPPPPVQVPTLPIELPPPPVQLPPPPVQVPPLPPPPPIP